MSESGKEYDRLTHLQRVTLSNTICGDVQSARELEQMGFLTIRSIEFVRGRAAAFFDLTHAGDALVERYHVIPDSAATTE